MHIQHHLMVMGDTLAPEGENGPPTYQTLSLNPFQ